MCLNTSMTTKQLILKNKMFFIITAILAFSCAQKQPIKKEIEENYSIKSCKYEENCKCFSPGITERWEWAFGMFKIGSDEFDLKEIYKIVDPEKPKNYALLSDCEKNIFWHKKICDLNKDYFKSRMECLNSDEGIPRIIKEGV